MIAAVVGKGPGGIEGERVAGHDFKVAGVKAIKGNIECDRVRRLVDIKHPCNRIPNSDSSQYIALPYERNVPIVRCFKLRIN